MQKETRAKSAGGFLWAAPLYQEKFAPRECGRRACNRVQPGGPARIRGVRRFLWEAVCFVCVSRVRMAPRRRREEYAGWPARIRGVRRTESAFVPRQGRGRIPMGSNTFYGAGLLLGSDAPQARIGCRLSPADRVRFYARALWARGVLWEAMRFVCVSCVRMAPRRRHEEYAGSTRPPVRAEEGAGSACRASPAD